MTQKEKTSLKKGIYLSTELAAKGFSPVFILGAKKPKLVSKTRKETTIFIQDFDEDKPSLKSLMAYKEMMLLLIQGIDKMIKETE